MATIRIKDSYLIRTREGMSFCILRERHNHPESEVWQRTDKSLIREWRSHNLLYDLGLFRSHTKDVDFNYPTRWYEDIGYAILSLLYIA